MTITPIDRSALPFTRQPDRADVSDINGTGPLGAPADASSPSGTADSAAAAAAGSDPRGDAGFSMQDFAAAVGRAALAWHQPHLTQQQVVQAVTDTAAALLPAVGAAILTRRSTGHLDLTAAAGTLPPQVRALHHDHDNAREHPTAWQRPTDRAVTGRQRHGWPVATTTHDESDRTALIYVPLGLGRVVFGTLLINTEPPVTADTEVCAVTFAMHACTAISAARQRDQLRSYLCCTGELPGAAQHS